MSSIQRTRRLTAGLAGLALAAIAGAQSISSPQAIEIPQAVEQTARRHITAAALRGPIRFLAHDLLESQPVGKLGMGEQICIATDAAGDAPLDTEEMDHLGMETVSCSFDFADIFSSSTHSRTLCN